MGVERQEDITVEQDRFSVQLKTEQTTTQTEIFSSVEQARESKNSAQWKETGMGIIWGGSGVAAVLQGLEHIVTAADKGNYNEAVIGIQLVALGSVFLNNLGRAIDARGLAKRQVERLQTTVSRIGRSQEQLPPQSNFNK